MGTWIIDNWFALAQTAGIIGSLLFAGISLRIDTKTRRVSNLMTLTQQHREIWTLLYKQPELSRILKAQIDSDSFQITEEEKIFVGFLILHLGSAYHAIQYSMFLPPEGLKKDIQAFFSLPIPQKVWREAKALHNRDFVRFVEECLSASL